MFFLKIPVFAAILALFAAGCSSSGTGTGVVCAPPDVDSATMARRTAELAKTIAPCKVRGLELRPEDLRQNHLDTPEAFLGFVRKMGFNRIYLMLDSPEALEVDGLDDLFKAAAASGIPVVAVLPESAYVLGHQGYWFQRFFHSAGTTLEQMLKKLRNFETREFHFAGVVVLAQPHLFTALNRDRPKELIYAWSDKTFGPGLDNDMLMKLTLEKLANFRQELAPTPLTVEIPDFYEELVMNGQLSHGSVADFKKNASQVIILDAGNKPSEVLEAVRNELKNAPPDSLLVAIPLAEHTSVTSGALRRRNWPDYIRSLGYAVTRWKDAPAFGGVVLGPLFQIETLLQEK